jgi:hypothetical protein
MGRRAPGGDGQETKIKIEVGGFGFGCVIELKSAMRAKMRRAGMSGVGR